MTNAFTDDRRGVLRITGADSHDLLQDLVTNDLKNLSGDALIYAALLTPQGKYLFDFFLFEQDGAIMLDVAKDRAPALAQRLMMYRLRRDMTVEGTDLAVTLSWGGDTPAGSLPDPRDAALGWRSYGEAVAPTATQADYDALRVSAMVPDTGAELIADESYILEMGFERLNGVDFRKGCYVGQEVTARMKHKTELRKGLALVSVEGEAAPGAAITAEGKPAGSLLTVSGDRALAHLRYDRATTDMMAGEAVLRRVGTDF